MLSKGLKDLFGRLMHRQGSCRKRNISWDDFVFQPVKKLSDSYETLGFHTVFATARLNSVLGHMNPSNIHICTQDPCLILNVQLCLSPQMVCSSTFIELNFIYIYYLSHACYISRQFPMFLDLTIRTKSATEIIIS